MSDESEYLDDDCGTRSVEWALRECDFGDREGRSLTGINSGNATSFTILSPHVSTLSSERPTQARLGANTRTSPDVGECDL